MRIEYWREAWDRAPSDLVGEYGTTYEGVRTYPGKVLHLLASYAAFSKTMKILDYSVHFDKPFRFFNGTYNDQYRRQVENAIANFYQMSGLYQHSEQYHHVEFILSRVCAEIGRNAVIRSDDNLFLILEVIREKTAVDFTQLGDPDEIERRFDRSAGVVETTRDLNSVTIETRVAVIPAHPRNKITNSLTRYLDAFKDKESFSDAFKRLGIPAEETEYLCPVAYDVPNVPVQIDGIVFDYAVILELDVGLDGTRVNPSTKDKFYLDQLQPDRKCKIQIEAFISQHEATQDKGMRL